MLTAAHRCDMVPSHVSRVCIVDLARPGASRWQHPLLPTCPGAVQAEAGSSGVMSLAPGMQPPQPLTGDPDDDVILACAVAAGAEVLMSGDRRHLLPVREHRGVRIVAPPALLAELASE